MKIIEYGAFVEVKIPNKVLDKYKTMHGFKNFIRHSIIDFMDRGLTSIGDMVIYSSNGVEMAYADDKLCEINDLNYSCYNLIKKNKEFRTFRFFSGRIGMITDDLFDGISLFKCHDVRYNHKKLEYSVTLCSAMEFKARQ